MKLFPIHEATSSGERCPVQMDETVQSYLFPHLYVDEKGGVSVRVHRLGWLEIDHRIMMKLPLGVDPHEVVKPTSKANGLVRRFFIESDSADRDELHDLRMDFDREFEELIIDNEMHRRFGTVSPEDYFEWDDIEREWRETGLTIEEWVNWIVDDLGANGSGAYQHMVVSREHFLAHVRDEIQKSASDD